MSTISAVLWDVGGTLLKSVIPAEQFIIDCLAAAGVARESLNMESLSQAEQFRKQSQLVWRTANYENEGLIEYAMILLGPTGASDDTVRRFAARLAEYYDVWTVVPGIPALLSDLRDAGIVEGVVSNWAPSLRDVLRGKSGCGPYTSIHKGSTQWRTPEIPMSCGAGFALFLR